MPFPSILREGLEAYQSQAATICALAAPARVLRPNCCFDTDAAGLTVSIEVRDVSGAVVLSGLGDDPLADLARQLGVTYPFSYATGNQKQRILNLLDTVKASSKERAQVMATISTLRIHEARALLGQLQVRADALLEEACECQRRSLRHLQAA